MPSFLLLKGNDMNNISWDSYFMTLAYLVAMKSRDKSTKLGAVIVGPDKEIRSTGYNSFIRNINDSIQERQERPEKYYWFEHAERNAIYNASLIGISLKNCTIYVPGMPCSDCIRGILQSGIIEIVLHDRWLKNQPEKWTDSGNRSKIMCLEKDIPIRIFSGDIQTEIYGWNRSEKILL